MDRVNALRNSIKLRFKRAINGGDMKNNDFITKTYEERKCVEWTIENIHVCPLEKGEYLESPPFYSGYFNSTKWIVRLYPRGRNSSNLGKVGLFIHKISSAARCSISYEFKLLDSSTVEGHFDNRSAFDELDKCGTDEFLRSEDLSRVKRLKIECNILVRYLDEVEKYQIVDKGFPNCTCVLSEDLKNLYRQEKHTDAILQVGKMNMRVHKAILAARSKVFSDRLKNAQKNESSLGIIPVEGIEEPVAMNLIEYIYTGTIENMTAYKAISLYPVAKKYSLKELRYLCLNVILATMSVNNFCRIAALADMHSSSKLKQKTKSFFCNHSAQILDREDWKRFIFERRSLALEMMEALSSEMKAKCSVINHVDS